MRKSLLLTNYPECIYFIWKVKVEENNTSFTVYESKLYCKINVLYSTIGGYQQQVMEERKTCRLRGQTQYLYQTAADVPIQANLVDHLSTFSKLHRCYVSKGPTLTVVKVSNTDECDHMLQTLMGINARSNIKVSIDFKVRGQMYAA